MVDATGMCGACRVTVGGKTKFCCVDGPEFDGHEVDYDELVKRQRAYLTRGEGVHGTIYGGRKIKGVEMAEKEEKEKKPKVPRQKMPEQEPKVRARNFDEVPFGYTPELAQLEASRCLQCKKPKCIEGCPVEVDIPAFVKLISEGDFAGAARKLK